MAVPWTEPTQSFSMLLCGFCIRAHLGKICQRATELIRLYRRFQAWSKSSLIGAVLQGLARNLHCGTEADLSQNVSSGASCIAEMGSAIGPTESARAGKAWRRRDTDSLRITIHKGCCACGTEAGGSHSENPGGKQNRCALLPTSS